MVQVKNYYALNEAELERDIHNIRNWLFDFNGHPQYGKALFALDVALCALELRAWELKDEFIKLVLEQLFEQ